jgi:hypothetical protein
MCPLEQCSNPPHVQTQNITFCYNKEEIITKVIPLPQSKGHIGIWHKLTSTNTMQTRITYKLKLKKLLCEQSNACHLAYTRLNTKMEEKWMSAVLQGYRPEIQKLWHIPSIEGKIFNLFNSAPCLNVPPSPILVKYSSTVQYEFKWRKSLKTNLRCLTL